MLSKWPIRKKLLIGITLLIVIVATLSGSGFIGLYAYRSLVKTVSRRATKLPLAAALGQTVSDLRVTVSDLSRHRKLTAVLGTSELPHGGALLAQQFKMHFVAVRQAANQYRQRLAQDEAFGSNIRDHQRERQYLKKIEEALSNIAQLSRHEDWMFDDMKFDLLGTELEQLIVLSAKLPALLHADIGQMAGKVRNQYRTLIVLVWLSSVSAGLMFAVFASLFYKWIFRPLRVLIQGSRRLAAGQFDHRIRLETQDEMSELAQAMNDMTERFQAIHDDLDQQVRQRTKQVVRSEQLASVGFLAAGVAHEINNPLASIAMCSESLEMRLHEVMQAGNAPTDQRHQEQFDVVRGYLQMIQDEAFRCKEITEKLLDFSRMGDLARHRLDLRQLIQSVIDMVSHLGMYKNKNVLFVPGSSVTLSVCAPEIKQVVLNLITNGLDSLEPGGTVTVELCNRDGKAEILFTDDGCGMTEDVRQHLFEPFFTRRRGGQGTGLGLSITYRIVADHDGNIEAISEGPGMGSQFRVTLPLAHEQKEKTHHYQAA